MAIVLAPTTCTRITRHHGDVSVRTPPAGPREWACGPPSDGTGLELSNPMESSTGIAARRVERDPSGRVTRTVYYREASSLDRPPAPGERYIPASLQVATTDDAGRVETHRECDPEGRVTRSLSLRRGSSGGTHQRAFRADGTLEREVRCERFVCNELEYDAAGRAVVGARGALPAGVDLAQGWGPEGPDRLACSASAAPARGRRAAIRVTAYVVNRGDAAHDVRRDDYEALAPELVDAAGRPVAHDPGWLRRFQFPQPDQRARNVSHVPPGHVERVASVALDFWYPGLAPGRYTLRVRYGGGPDGRPPRACGSMVVDVTP